MYDDLELPVDSPSLIDKVDVSAWPYSLAGIRGALISNSSDPFPKSERRGVKGKETGKVRKKAAASTVFKPRHLSAGGSSGLNYKKELPGKIINRHHTIAANLCSDHKYPFDRKEFEHRFESKFIPRLSLEDALFTTSFRSETLGANMLTTHIEYDPAMPNDEDVYHNVIGYEAVNSQNDYTLQVLDYTTLSRTIQITELDLNSVEAVLSELHTTGDIIKTDRSSPGACLLLTYGNQTDCVSAYHSLAVGTTRDLCFRKFGRLPCVRFV